MITLDDNRFTVVIDRLLFKKSYSLLDFLTDQMHFAAITPLAHFGKYIPSVVMIAGISIQ